MSLMHPEQLPPEPRQFPIRLVIVVAVGVFLFALAALVSPPPPAVRATPTIAVVSTTQTAPPTSAAQRTPTTVSLQSLAFATTTRAPSLFANALNIICDGTATPAPLITPGQPVSGQLDGCGTVLFRVTTQVGDRLTIRLHVPNGNTYLSLHDANGEEIADDPIDTDRETALIETGRLPLGMYTIYARDLRSRNLDFTLTVTVQPGS